MKLRDAKIGIRKCYLLNMTREECIERINNEFRFHPRWDGQAYAWGFSLQKRPLMLGPIRERYKYTFQGLFIEKDELYLCVNADMFPPILPLVLVVLLFSSFVFVVSKGKIGALLFALFGCILIMGINIAETLLGIKDSYRQFEAALGAPKAIALDELKHIMGERAYADLKF